MAIKQARAAKWASRGNNKYKARIETSARKALLSNLPGSKLKHREFEQMLGQSFTKSNQIKSIKDLSTNLQNIFRLNHS